MSKRRAIRLIQRPDVTVSLERTSATTTVITLTHPAEQSAAQEAYEAFHDGAPATPWASLAPRQRERWRAAVARAQQL